MDLGRNVQMGAGIVAVTLSSHVILEIPMSMCYLVEFISKERAIILGFSTRRCNVARC